MLIGTIEGVYSTIYLSCPVVLFWHEMVPLQARAAMKIIFDVRLVKNQDFILYFLFVILYLYGYEVKHG